MAVQVCTAVGANKIKISTEAFYLSLCKYLLCSLEAAPIGISADKHYSSNAMKTREGK